MKAVAPSYLTFDGFIIKAGWPGQVESFGSFKFFVTVQYALNQIDFSSAPDPTWEFDTGGGNETMFVSLQTKQKIMATGISGTAPDFKSAINVTDSGAQGVSRVVSTYAWSDTRYYDPADVDTTFKNKLFQCTGKVNDATWNGYAAGEALFLGARGASPNGGWCPITYRFLASANLVSGSIGPFSGINKDGWDYLWFLYDETEDATAKRVIKRPVSCYVELVYERKSFNTLLGW
ncbi:MAG: hypothetical protein K8R92_00760 [Planctomycetes bacterium]|nr:hypothetical protein [Planctomycetota bacterium]